MGLYFSSMVVMQYIKTKSFHRTWLVVKFKLGIYISSFVNNLSTVPTYCRSLNAFSFAGDNDTFKLDMSGFLREMGKLKLIYDKYDLLYKVFKITQNSVGLKLCLKKLQYLNSDLIFSNEVVLCLTNHFKVIIRFRKRLL